MKRPEKYNAFHRQYLNRLRASGKTNMMGAANYLRQVDDTLNRQEAMDILLYWMLQVENEEEGR